MHEMKMYMPLICLKENRKNILYNLLHNHSLWNRNMPKETLLCTQSGKEMFSLKSNQGSKAFRDVRNIRLLKSCFQVNISKSYSL